MAYQLAQVNISVLLEPLTSERLADFVAALDPVNAVADAAPGFEWRLQTEDGDATAVRAFGDERILVNMSVWESVAALGAYVYGPEHVAVMRRRRKWFALMGEAYTALWWVPAGTRPTVADAEDRLAHVRAHGPTAYAFTLKRPFPPPGGSRAHQAPEDWYCPA
jgi:predicted small integral membrane protein